MRKLILFNMMSLDGFFAGPESELDWHHVDDEFNEFAIEQTGSAGLLLFGRMTYELMSAFWPTPAALETDPEIAAIMNSVPKIVFSRTLEQADWQNTRLVKTNPFDEIIALKKQPGKDIFLFGSAELASELIQHGLIDEFRIMVNPVILGSGRPLFKDIYEPLSLNLEKTRTFRNGNVLLTYHPEDLEAPSAPD